MVNFRVICINDSDKPETIPLSSWVKKGEIYTVIEVSRLLVQGGRLGYKLAEINIDHCFPYQFFSANRFVPYVPSTSMWAELTLEKLLEEAKEEEKEQLVTK